MDSLREGVLATNPTRSDERIVESGLGGKVENSYRRGAAGVAIISLVRTG